MGSKIKPEDRKHKPHQHLKPEDEEVLRKFLPIQMTEVRDGWVFKEGWSIRRVATALGTPFTAHNVATFVRKNFWAPTPVDQPEPAAPQPPVPDAVGCFWTRLDAISHDVAGVAKNLAEHRANNAKMMDDLLAEVSAVKKIALAIAKEWKLVE